MNKKITIKNVAKAADVSVATVSHVLNNYPDISEKTKRKVNQVVERLGYSPNIAARSLVYKKQKTIALILNEIDISKKVSLPAEVSLGVFDFCDEIAAQYVFYATTLKEQKEKSFKQFCQEHNITGAIVQGLKITDPYYEEIQSTDFPTVLIDLENKNPKIGSIGIDNRAAGMEITDFLIDNGHQQIGMINGSKYASVSLQRQLGYQDALIEHDIAVKEDFIEFADFSESLAYEKAKQLLSSHPEITAIFSASDLMALGVIKAAKELGRILPRDLSIFAFDNIAVSEFLSPSLSTVEQNMRGVAYRAAKLLDDIIDRNYEHSWNIKSDYELVIRNSVINRFKTIN
ncbi:Catabolite control protein A [Oenococcus oeni]|uniref:LacI family DNA-binding transcriptional regulator n=1 Tax=Oenococcus oeni TaxID=1247 RepID=UPI0010B5B493|nr:LacI family DNA-binding transcriptional regulator [Oenococcus oeni]SYW01405.1 Catabolite control protein A [Oenococcus oeni]